jgi:menaquinone-specific isochorismate synthase
VARTVPLDPALAADLLAVLPAGPTTAPCSWVRRGEGLVGWGRAASHVAVGADRFAELASWWEGLVATAVVRDEVDLPGTGPVAFGSVAYSDVSSVGGTLVVPEVVVGRRGDVAWLTTVSAEGEVAAVPGPAEVVPQGAPSRPVDVAFADGALSPAAWEGAVATAVSRITAGELDKVVLARDLEVSAHEPLDVRWLLRRLAERYRTTWVFAVDGLVGATPELLVRREKGLVTSRVLAGTIRPTGDDAHDLALAASLARSSKDLEEHEYAVRSVADALAPHCSSMNVPETPFVLHLSNVMHLATDVAGVLVDDTSSLTLAASLHPSAAVCGTPRAVADEVIAELEHMDRGRYAGPVGWIDADGDGEWGIALRCGAVSPEDPSRMRLFAGCGIVAGSVPSDELAESSAKLVPMRDALTADAP